MSEGSGKRNTQRAAQVANTTEKTMISENTVKVFQVKEEARRGMSFKYPEDFSHVATVRAGAYDGTLEDLAFERTNSIREPWYSAPGAMRTEDAMFKRPLVETYFEEEGCRSTSVNDVLVVNGKPLVVKGFGFGPLDEDSVVKAAW